MTIKPLADRVVVKSVEAEEKTTSGIILTPSAQEKPQIAEVVAVGPGGLVDGKEIKMTVKVGDRVITSKYTGTSSFARAIFSQSLNNLIFRKEKNHGKRNSLRH